MPNDPNERFDRFNPRTAVVKLIHEVRTIVASWPDDLSMEPLIAQLRYEADRLEQREKGGA